MKPNHTLYFPTLYRKPPIIVGLDFVSRKCCDCGAELITQSRTQMRCRKCAKIADKAREARYLAKRRAQRLPGHGPAA